MKGETDEKESIFKGSHCGYIAVAFDRLRGGQRSFGTTAGGC